MTVKVYIELHNMSNSHLVRFLLIHESVFRNYRWIISAKNVELRKSNYSIKKVCQRRLYWNPEPDYLTTSRVIEFLVNTRYRKSILRVLARAGLGTSLARTLPSPNYEPSSDDVGHQLNLYGNLSRVKWCKPFVSAIVQLLVVVLFSFSSACLLTLGSWHWRMKWAWICWG